MHSVLSLFTIASDCLLHFKIKQAMNWDTSYHRNNYIQHELKGITMILREPMKIPYTHLSRPVKWSRLLQEVYLTFEHRLINLNLLTFKVVRRIHSRLTHTKYTNASARSDTLVRERFYHTDKPSKLCKVKKQRVQRRSSSNGSANRWKQHKSQSGLLFSINKHRQF